MHSLLEQYLSEVAAQLESLPPKQRVEELREMRAHLESAVAAGREQGQTEDEAAQTALAQFGTPDTVGAETAAAWRRGVRRNRRSFWGAAACGFGLLWTVPHLMGLLERAYLIRSFAYQSVPASAVYFVTLWDWATYLLVGGIVGIVFGRRAVAAVGMAWGAGVVWEIVGGAYRATHANHTFGPSPTFIIPYVLQGVVKASISLLAAWVVSRWRDPSARLVRE